MRKILALCIIALFFNCTSKSEHNKIVYTRMEIRYVDLDILTPIDVDCNNFESFFNNEIKVKIITDTLLINKFVTELNRLRSDSITPDTRITVILSGNNLNERRLCIDKFNILDGNNNYSNSGSVLKIIDKLLDRDKGLYKGENPGERSGADKPYDQRAVGFENRVRKAMGLPERTLAPDKLHVSGFVNYPDLCWQS